jgi:hypothetical protein
MKRLVRRSFVAALLGAGAYLAVLVYPQPLFAHELRSAMLTVHAIRPIPPAMHETMARATARLQASPLYPRAAGVQVFLCDDQRLFAVFARQNYRVGGIADALVSQHVFLRESDMQHDRLISPSGTPVAADRPLSYFIAHEAMHIAIARHVGRVRYARLPQWVDDGYADYVARSIDYGDALRKLKEDARELDPARSGLYLRYHLMVAYLLEKKGMRLDDLLDSPPPAEQVLAELRARGEW